MAGDDKLKSGADVGDVPFVSLLLWMNLQIVLFVAFSH